ncbi:glycerol-3-phosphate dehydrogenase [Thermobacillus composti KWC4]|uniref:Glycerol-3-phosphate dehydrogenase n=1 Tax=Thermobacillus composti (strain DSM 18247 / JCM 13945 / KWC4) TaxID=717605 RepID=L0E8J5_THECK|nr:glycerol-3-phosphate dehydrogenase/oxidase [Thermobacillus composti]AGA56623.1 glycerol-3-phosphate dehydrogenase [Thermobacillus composti KWC4]
MRTSAEQEYIGAWSALERERMLQSLAGETVDLLVIGGGITGAGIALDAVTRGLRTALVEMQDFAAGTSSRSTKLIHGGLRYLKQLEFKVVAETGRERAVVYENGPHVTTPEWMLLPFYSGGQLGPFTSRLGLTLYDYLARVKKDEWHKMLNARETLEREPLLRSEGLRGGGYYVEYRTDDARLTLEVLKRAVELGATAVNYAAVTGLRYDGTRLSGAVVQDRIGGGEYELRARHIINATGPWVDDIREMDRSKEGKTLRLTKGVHLVFDQERFPLRQAVYFDTPDGRMVFAIPRDGKTYIGTTDTDYAGDPGHPRMEEDDLSYLLDAANYMFPSLGLTPRDVESSWAGLRPLIRQEGKNPSDISRKDEIFLSPSGLISIAGGKLTGYRKMAERVVDLVSRRRQADDLPALPASRTRTLAISGGDVGGSAGYEAYVRQQTEAGIAAGLGPDEAERIARRYGSNAPRLFELAVGSRDFADRHGLPLALAAELRYAVLAEMAATPADFWIRRTGRLFFDRPGVLRWKDAVSAAMAELLRWSGGQRESYDRELDRLLAEAVEP